MGETREQKVRLCIDKWLQSKDLGLGNLLVLACILI